MIVEDLLIACIAGAKEGMISPTDLHRKSHRFTQILPYYPISPQAHFTERSEVYFFIFHEVYFATEGSVFLMIIESTSLTDFLPAETI